MRSSTSSKTATVVTVGRPSTEVLSSLEASVDGATSTSVVRVRPAAAPRGAFLDATAMTPAGIAQIATFVHQLLEANATGLYRFASEHRGALAATPAGSSLATTPSRDAPGLLTRGVR